MKRLLGTGLVLLLLSSAGCAASVHNDDIFGSVDAKKSFEQGPAGVEDNLAGGAGTYHVTSKFYGTDIDYYTSQVKYRNYGNWVEFIDSKTGKKIVLDSRSVDVRQVESGRATP